MEAEVNKGIKADQIRVEMLRNQVRLAADNAQRLAASGEYRRILEENGAVNLTAFASTAATEYSYSLPSNRVELWFLMESQRLLHPVFREFYKERDVVVEEYRQRWNPIRRARLMGELLVGRLQGPPLPEPVRRVAQRHLESAPRGRRPSSSAITSPATSPSRSWGRHRGRRQTPGGALLRPHGGEADAARGDHRGTAAGRPEDRDRWRCRDRPSRWSATSVPASTIKTTSRST